MTKTSTEAEQDFIVDLRSSSGMNLEDWMGIIQDSGNVNRNDIVKWLKLEKGFGHMNAALLTGIYLNSGNPVYEKSRK